MKPIKLSDTEKLLAAIVEAEGRATVRVITPDDISNAIIIIEKKLSIPKKYMDGVSAEVDYNAQQFPNAYKYTPESTFFDAINKKGIWYITSIYRGRTRGTSHAIAINLTDAAKAEMLVSHTMFAI